MPLVAVETAKIARNCRLLPMNSLWDSRSESIPAWPHEHQVKDSVWNGVPRPATTPPPALPRVTSNNQIVRVKSFMKPHHPHYYHPLPLRQPEQTAASRPHKTVDEFDALAEAAVHRNVPAKLQNCSMKQIIAWAASVGVDEETRAYHQSKQIDLVQLLNKWFPTANNLFYTLASTP